MNEGSIYRVETIDNTPVAVPYANLSLGGAELDYYGYKTSGGDTEVFTSNRGTIRTGIWTYGNISDFCAYLVTSSSISLSGNTPVELCKLDTNDGLVSVDDALKYAPLRHFASPIDADCGVFGFSPSMRTFIDDIYKLKIGYSFSVSSSRVSGSLTISLIDSNDSLTIPSDTPFSICGMFMNAVGNPYDN